MKLLVYLELKIRKEEVVVLVFTTSKISHISSIHFGFASRLVNGIAFAILNIQYEIYLTIIKQSVKLQ